jgi:hypothetical protein
VRSGSYEGHRTASSGLPGRAAGQVLCVAALLYSLIGSARLAGVEPRAYLREAVVRAIRNRGTVALLAKFN